MPPSLKKIDFGPRIIGRRWAWKDRLSLLFFDNQERSFHTCDGEPYTEFMKSIAIHWLAEGHKPSVRTEAFIKKVDDDWLSATAVEYFGSVLGARADKHFMLIRADYIPDEFRRPDQFGYFPVESTTIGRKKQFDRVSLSVVEHMIAVTSEQVLKRA